MPKHKHDGIKVLRKDNVYLILRDAQADSGFQHRSSFATEARGNTCTPEVYEDIANNLDAKRYLAAANLAGQHNDHDLKKRICMAGVRHYTEEIGTISGNNFDKRTELAERANMHEIISELYSIAGNREQAEQHLNLSTQAASGILPDY